MFSIAARGFRRVYSKSGITVPWLIIRGESTRSTGRSESHQYEGVRKLLERFEGPGPIRHNEITPASPPIPGGILHSSKRDLNDVEINSYDYASLGPTIEKNSCWCIGSSQDGNSTEQSPYFLSCFAVDQNCQFGELHFVREFSSAPTPEELLNFIKCCIIRPITRPHTLPEILFIPKEFNAHLKTIQPFLDSLPFPFRWEMMPPLVDVILHGQALSQFNEGREYLNIAEEEAAKPHGRARAIELFEMAIECFECVREGMPVDETEQIVLLQKFLAVIHKFLFRLRMEAGQSDPQVTEAAILNGKKIEEYDPTGTFGYMALCLAYQRIGNSFESYAALQRGLMQPNMHDNKDIQQMVPIMETIRSGLDVQQAKK
ncbi:hypothetical protein Hypma_000462 [Hypsizygus marmoreus]|uniref:Uncharacterized protein n=1 Tax=Hypsizygus marmoreus TaxID=39966 RepID=A0A369J8F6_HYPMA|nr:hypothetical protein Hypma_000462 [Hypsizygus marmoreus]